MDDKSWVNKIEELLKLNKTQELVDSWTQYEITRKLEENKNSELARYDHSKLLAFLYQGAGMKMLDSSNENSKKLISKSYDMWKKIWYSERNKDDMECLKQLFHLVSTGLLIDSFAEVRMILMEYDLHSLHIKTKDFNWEQYLEYNIYILLLILIRKANGWEDIKYSKQVLIDIEETQERMEEDYLISIEDKDEAYSKMCWLGSMLNVLEAIEIYLNYALTGKPENIDKKILGLCRDSYELLKSSSYEEEKFTVLLIEKCLIKLVKISVWNNVYGISDKLDKYVQLLVSENKEKPIFELWPSQQQAISKNLFDTNKTSVVVQMPTSAGKTLLAKFYILQALNLYNDAKIIYLVPTRALVNQVKRDLRVDFKDFDNIIVDVAIPFADIDPIENELILSDTNVLVTTPEKMDILVRSKHPIVDSVRLVVVDEAHSIQDKGRGSNLELLLSILRKENRNLRILMLSPFINNANEIAKWLGDNRGHDIYIDWKPAQQYTGIYNLEKKSNKNYFGVVEYLPSSLNTSYSKPFKVKIHHSSKKGLSKMDKAVLTSNVYEKQGGVLILCTQKRYAENVCKKIMESREINEENLNKLNMLLDLIEYEMGKDSLIYKSVQRGVAYHHSALPLNIREEIEEAFVNRLLNPVAATTTLAQGMNFPVSTVIFQGMSIYDGESRNMTDAEFWNIAGRAGRALTDKEGHIIAIGNNDSDYNQFNEYLKKKNNDVLSSLLKTLEFIPENEFSLYWLKQSKEFCALLKYIYHIVLIGQESDIEDILRGSLVYYQLTERGSTFYGEKLVRITKNYLTKISEDTKRKKFMEAVDKTGLNNISMKYLLNKLRNNPSIDLSPDKLFNYSDNNLTEVIKIIHEIPEMELNFGGKGNFSPELVAEITKDWVNGRSIKEIADKNISFISDSDERITICGGYIYSTLVNNLPWGVSAMLSAKAIASNNKDNVIKDEDVMIPSYIYFGVKNKEASALSMIGVPRFAADKLGTAWKNEFNNKDNVDIKNISEWLNLLDESDWISKFDKENERKAKLAFKMWKKQK